MPTLPTLTITNQAVWDRLLIIFENDPEKYLAWLRRNLRDEVEQRELKKLFADMETVANQRRLELKNFLDAAT